jgi:hypothetical protein
MITAGDALSGDRLPIYLSLARTSSEHAVPGCCINSGSPPYGFARRRYRVLARCRRSALACYQGIDGGASPPPSIVIQRQTSLVPFGKGGTSALLRTREPAWCTGISILTDLRFGSTQQFSAGRSRRPLASSWPSSSFGNAHNKSSDLPG